MNETAISIIESLVRRDVNDNDLGYITRLVCKYPEGYAKAIKDADEVDLFAAYTSDRLKELFKFHKL